LADRRDSSVPRAQGRPASGRLKCPRAPPPRTRRGRPRQADPSHDFSNQQRQRGLAGPLQPPLRNDRTCLK
jgi:hypothetical protein